MGKIILVLGGARSGKSSFAVETAAKTVKRVIFIATAVGIDREMKQRISAHQIARPKHWITKEAPYNITAALRAIPADAKIVIIDCLTIYITNLIMKKRSDDIIIKDLSNLFAFIKKSNFTAIIVSNEVGLGLVPDTKLGRRFRDLAGAVNKLAAQKADQAYFLVSGIALNLKNKRNS
ncbi:MAG: bifunctional adenosylcobinamide kinase/adenosylcobinamide-phosphate guanylyltransferase [Candidatus Omnitrophota bacterium]